MTRLWLGLVTLVDCFSRIIVRMANYNQTTQEIARPSELLVGIAAYTTSLQSLSSYINVDVTRLVKSVLLQQTRPQDARGAQTITTLYTNWCAWHILYLLTHISQSRSAAIVNANQVVCGKYGLSFSAMLSVLSSVQPFCFLLCQSYCAHAVFDVSFARFLESLLRQASNSLIVHCPTLHCFVSQSTDNEQSFRAEEYSDVAGQAQSSLLFTTVSNHFVSHC